mgnify:CR=1 FL=1
MNLNTEALKELCGVAQQAAVAAGEYIKSVDRRSLVLEHKATGTSLASQVVTEVDRECERIIREHLAPSCQQYNLALLSEERAESHAAELKNRFTQDYFWCVDPLDGTLPFTQGKPGYAVSIALVSKRGTPIVGVVYDPVTQDLFYAVEAGGAFKNDKPLVMPSKRGASLTVMADHSFKDDLSYPQLQSLLQGAATELGYDGFTEVYGNGAVKNACGLLSGAPACYLKRPKAAEGGGSLWDFAATACLISEAGGWMSDFSGQPLDLNRLDSTFMNHRGVLFASSAEVARSILRLT